jgi:hypothetical protein
MIQALTNLIRQMGAPSEQATERDGAFSQHEETHAAGFMFGIGLLLPLAGMVPQLGAFISLVFGTSHGKTPIPIHKDLMHDIQAERHYAIGGLATGIVLGLAIRYAGEIGAVATAVL